MSAQLATCPPASHGSAGEARKLNALGVHEACRGVYLLRGRRALLQALLAHETATADHVRDAVELPPQVDPVCLGAVPGALVRAGIIERAGYAPSTRADAHARPVSVWRLRDREAAMRWLVGHPDQAGPTAGIGEQLGLF